MRDVSPCLSRSGCPDLLNGMPDYRNLLYAPIASFLISPPLIFDADTLFAASFDSYSTWTRVDSNKCGPFAMVVTMKLKARPSYIVAFFLTSFLISFSLLAMTPGISLYTPSLISRISVFSPTCMHLSLASFYSSCQFPISWFVSSSAPPTPISCLTLKLSKHFLFIGINPIFHHAFQIRSFVNVKPKGRISMGSSKLTHQVYSIVHSIIWWEGNPSYFWFLDH